MLHYRLSWLLPCILSPLCDYRFFVDAMEHNKTAVLDREMRQHEDMGAHSVSSLLVISHFPHIPEIAKLTGFSDLDALRWHGKPYRRISILSALGIAVFTNAISTIVSYSSFTLTLLSLPLHSLLAVFRGPWCPLMDRHPAPVNYGNSNNEGKLDGFPDYQLRGKSHGTLQFSTMRWLGIAAPTVSCFFFSSSIELHACMDLPTLSSA